MIITRATISNFANADAYLGSQFPEACLKETVKHVLFKWRVQISVDI